MPDHLNFTQASLQDLAWKADPKHPRKDRYYVYDTKRVGLAVCVTNTGAKVFYHVHKHKSRTRRYRIGTFPPLTPQQARAEADKLNGKYANGEDPTEERRAVRGAMTLGELHDHYIESHAKHHNKRWLDEQRQFERYFGKSAKPSDAGVAEEKEKKVVPFPGWRNKRVNVIKSEDIRNLKNQLGERHGQYAANRVLAMLSGMFTNANLSNPVKGVKKFTEHRRERFLDTDELQRFFKSINEEPNETLADFFRMLLFTLARRSNVGSMAWENVSFGRREWTVAGEKTKNGDPLVVSLTDEAMEILRRRKEARSDGERFVFPSHGKYGHIVEPKGAWARILERAGISNFRIHDVRHTGASWMAMGGASLLIIGKALGHKSEQSTARYAHLNRSVPAAALQAATSAMAKAGEAPKKKKAKKEEDSVK